jgi:MFS family permease
MAAAGEGRYKWWALALLCVACLLQQGMRQIFPPLASSIGDEFGASAAFRGSVMGVFTLIYALAVPFSGMAGDFLSRKKIVIFSLLVFSLGVLGASWAAGILGIMLLYGALNGFGQSFFYPAATSLIQQLHSERKATALSILQMALYSGIVLFSFASGKMLDVCGNWRVPFKVFGIAGVVWAIALVFLLRDTKAHSVGATGGRPLYSEALRAVFSKPSAILLALALGMQIFVDVGFKMWMPTYLKESFPQLGAAACGLHAVLWHYLGAFCGVIVGSRIADKFVRLRHGVRMEMNIIGLVLGAPFILWMANAGSFVAVCTAMGLFGFFRGVYDSNQFASIFDVVAPRYRASAMGIVLAFAFAFGAIAPVVLGMVKDRFSMSVGLAALSAFFVLGAVLIGVARVCFVNRDYEG